MFIVLKSSSDKLHSILPVTSSKTNISKQQDSLNDCPTMNQTDSMVLNGVKTVCPSAEELSVVINNIQCSQCGSSFRNESRLRMHDLKVHQHRNLDKTVKESVRYHCPESSCVYSPASQRFFTTMKYLKQHYLKVHAAKTYSCTQCEKSFSTESAQAAHIRVCGTDFSCSCLKSFTSYEALLTHAKRLLHPIDEKYKNLLKRASQKLKPVVLVQIVPQKKQPISILPQQEKNPGLSETSISQNTCDAETQTDDLKKWKRLPSPSKSNKRRESRQTQTNVVLKEKRCRKTVETQTSTGCREQSKKSARKQKIPAPKTDLVLENSFPNESLFPSGSLQLQDDGIHNFWDDRTSSGCQTNNNTEFLDVFNDSVIQTEFPSLYTHPGEELTENPYGSDYFSSTSTGISRSDPMLTEEIFKNRFSSIETQTERANIFETDDTLSRTFALSSNTETQTSEHFDNFEHLLYSNMCTQTCNDILPSELGLSDIQTQTAWTDLEDCIV